MTIFLILLIIGAVSAIIGSIIGLGGGIIIVPALIFLSPIFMSDPITTAMAVGTSLTVLIFTAASSTLNFVRQKRVDFRSGLLFFITSGPAAIVGAMITGSLDAQKFQLYFGIFMLLMAILLLVKDRLKPIQIEWSIQRVYRDSHGVEHSYGYNIWVALLVGLGVGFVSGLFGIGGGSLLVPLMVLLFRYPPHVATATSMFVILLSAVTGSVTHISLGDVHWFSVIALAPGAVIGGWLGAWIAGRLSSKALMKVLLISFFLLSFRLIWEGLA